MLNVKSIRTPINPSINLND